MTQYKHKPPSPAYYRIGMLIILILITAALVCGCGLSLPKKHISPLPDQGSPEEQRLSDLVARAHGLARIKQYSEALRLYDEALSLAWPKAKKQILKKIDKILANASSQELEQVLGIPYEQIPDSLLFYHMGSVLLAEENHQKQAAFFLRKSLAADPLSSHAARAKKLLHKLNAVRFSPNTIGCLLPLSGKYALFGQQALQGIQLAIQNISQQYGMNFTIIIRDTQGDPEHAAACVEELAGEPIMGIIGPLVTAPKAGERAQELGIPMIAMTQKTEFLSKGDFLFSNFITPDMQVDSLSNYIFHTLKYKTAGILYPEEPYGKTFMNLFWDAAVQSGAQITGVRSYDGTLTDFSKSIEKLTGSYFHFPSRLSQSRILSNENNPLETITKRKKNTPVFQILFIPDGPSRLSLLLPQLTFNDITKILLVGTNLWHDPALVAEISRYQGNTVICDGYFGDSLRPEVQEFTKNFYELFQSEPGFLEAVAYDTAQIFFSVSRKAKANSRKQVKDILQSGKVFHGITGDTYFHPNGIANKKLFLLTVKKGKFVEIFHPQSENLPTPLNPVKENQ